MLHAATRHFSVAFIHLVHPLSNALQVSTKQGQNTIAIQTYNIIKGLHRIIKKTLQIFPKTGSLLSHIPKQHLFGSLDGSYLYFLGALTNFYTL